MDGMKIDDNASAPESDIESAPEGSDKDKRDDEQILDEARKRFEYVTDVDADNRRAAREDVEFVWVKGAQWPADIRQQRDSEARPWLEINQLPQFINQVVNDQRQGRPGIRVKPASGEERLLAKLGFQTDKDGTPHKIWAKPVTVKEGT